MRFIVDAQLPSALAGWHIAQGHEAVHVLLRRLAAMWPRVTEALARGEPLIELT
ncbi:MAG: hypothetical protein AB7U83_04595 [Vicinamibacterales bacterium]